MTYSPALAQKLFPSRTWYGDLGLTLAGAALIALLAQVTVPLWPVPVTGQTLGVLLVGAWMGFRLGVASVVAYIAAGACGAPVFAGGAAGVLELVGPTGGYLIGFVFSAGTAGLLAEHGFVRNLPLALGTMLVATTPVYVVGLAWLYTLLPARDVLAVGFWPFLPGAAAKIIVAALLAVRSARSASRAPRTRGS